MIPKLREISHVRYLYVQTNTYTHIGILRVCLCVYIINENKREL